MNKALRTYMSEKGIKNKKASTVLLEKTGRKVTPQQIGNYLRGVYKVPLEFARDWKTAFGFDLESKNESKVSRETLSSEHDFTWYRQAIDILIANNTDAIRQGDTKFKDYKHRTEQQIQDLRSERKELWDLIRRTNLTNSTKK